MARERRPGDLAVVSLHWGGNWVPAVPARHRAFARRLVELGAADLVHGHSSHHPLPAEVHAGRLILYGCGDLINDYEGLGPCGEWRSDLGCLYLATLERRGGRLRRLEILPFQLRRLRLSPVDAGARDWLERWLVTTGAALGSGLRRIRSGGWRLVWQE